MMAAVKASEMGGKSRINRVARKICSFPAVVVALIFLRVYWTCRENIADTDLWLHLRNAQYLVTHGRFPGPYSFTVSAAPWLSHEWLSELIYYGAFSHFGLSGVFVVFTATLAILLIAVFSLSMIESRDPFASAIATILGGLLAMVGFAPRAQNFGWLCFVALYAILLRFRSQRRAPLWLVPPLFAFWINCHGSWLIGLAIYAIFVLAGLFHRDLGNLRAAPWVPSELKKLIVTGIASILFLFANPFGHRLVFYPFDLAMNQKLNTGNVQEWASVDFNDPRGQQVILVLGALFLLAVLGRKRWRIDDAALIGLVLYSGLSHIRFLLLAGIVLPPIIAPQLFRLDSSKPRRERWIVNSILLFIVGTILVATFPSEQLLETENASFFPAGAVQFLRSHPQQGHIFNVFQWGGYLEWYLPDVPTFVDPRSDVFERNGVLKNYFEVVNLHNTEEILARYEVSYILYPAGTSLDYFLSKSPQWTPIYNDGQAAIYRRVPSRR